ncbi:brain protein I3 isoform X2 [Neophocaena asiaeorientalis asiaeorientalis]|uniref:Brain protein I3 isoform X2 n=1 Tax=Neophocaena asiaeorientalis asiaeorientalis TaxID=1706337 RepID=A0A341BGA1_NEOAA|nr:brain protein I3 isoform X2 [Neophocaena asiaeorientalis asiaeorientalis]
MGSPTRASDHQEGRSKQPGRGQLLDPRAANKKPGPSVISCEEMNPVNTLHGPGSGFSSLRPPGAPVLRGSDHTWLMVAHWCRVPCPGPRTKVGGPALPAMAPPPWSSPSPIHDGPCPPSAGA